MPRNKKSFTRMKITYGLFAMAVSAVVLLVSCSGPNISQEDAVNSVKKSIIRNDLLDRKIDRERIELENAVNDYFRKYSDRGIIYTVTSDFVSKSDCINKIHNIVENQTRGLNIAIELYDKNPMIFHYSYSSFCAVKGQYGDGEELRAGSYDEAYVSEMISCIGDSLAGDDFLDDLSSYFYGRIWETCQKAADEIVIESAEKKSGEWLIKTDKYGLFSVSKPQDEIIVVPKSLF